MTGRGAGDQTDHSAVAIDRRHTTALEWRVKGMSIDGIAVTMGISRITVQHYLQAALDVRALPDRVQELRLDILRLDRYLAILTERIENDEVFEDRGDVVVRVKRGGDVDRMIMVAVRVAERRARLLGLDSPGQLHTTFAQVDPAELEILELVNAAKAQVALCEAKWDDQQ